MKVRGLKVLFLVTAILLIAVTRGYTSEVYPKNTVHLYFDMESPQCEFAANDIKTSLSEKNFDVSFNNLSEIDDKHKGHRIIVATISDSSVVTLLNNHVGDSIPSLGEQSYALRTTTGGGLSYWVIGGDATGAMYGALQIAENVAFNGFSESYNEVDSPHLKNRGVKFNIPLDKNSPTYFYGHHGTSNMLAIKEVWNLDFWKTWFDEMARHRYNVLSLWSPAPFTSMLNMEEDYPGIAIDGVIGFDENKKEIVINKMTINEKIEFWRQVMKYGRDRGFSIYLFNWNIFLSTAENKHRLTYSSDNVNTKKYLHKCTVKLLETYPDLAGFGITVGERMGDIAFKDKEKWAWDVYGSAMKEYALNNPQRKLVFVHRQHDGNIDDILEYFKPLADLPNVKLNVSFKYSEAHAHTTTTPQRWHRTGMKEGLERNNIMAWLTVRNDDWYFLHWGNPQFVRDYINNFPTVNKYVDGFCIGSDGWVFTKEFLSNNSYYADKNALDIQRTWYMQKLWGRIAYNPTISDNLFKKHLAYRYPEVSYEKLFEAWSCASGAIRLANEQVTGHWDLDMDWWPEGWTGDTWKGNGRFFTLEDTKDATPFAGSKLCSFKNTANNKCGNKVSAWTTAKTIDSLGRNALSILSTLNSESNVELQLTLKDLTAQANLAMFNAYKFRATMYLIRDEKDLARTATGTAYCYWERYTAIMNKLYKAVDLQRNKSFSSWIENNQVVLKEYHNLGGKGIPVLNK